MNNTWKSKSGVFLIAEIGGNHEGDFNYAKKLTQLAIESNVDAIKFQIYTGDTLVSKVESPQRNTHFKKFELTKSQHIELATMCIDAGIQYNASVWDLDAIDWIDPYLTFYKIGSGDLTAYPVLEKIISKGKPILLSTGLSTVSDIEQCVEFICKKSSAYRAKEMLGILQCTSMYPIPPEDANLNVMNDLRSRFQAAIGYSDHTEGQEAVEVAVSMGAEILEMHFTDEREGKSFRDHKVSFTKQELINLAGTIKRIKTLQGSSVKQPTPSEMESMHVDSFRRAVYPSKDLEVGEILTPDKLVVLRPNVGIDARSFERLLGRKLRVPKLAFQQLSWDDLE